MWKGLTIVQAEIGDARLLDFFPAEEPERYRNRSEQYLNSASNGQLGGAYLPLNLRSRVIHTHVNECLTVSVGNLTGSSWLRR